MAIQSIRKTSVSYDGIYQDRSERRIRRNRERRARQLHRKIFLFIAGVLLGGILALIGNVIFSRAKDSAETVTYKYYQSYQINAGDTLTSIAQTYTDKEINSVSSYIKEVKQMNHLSDEDLLQAGDYLIIPYYSIEFIN